MTLPPRYARKYKSTYLKAKIADDSMWSLIPGVNPDISGLDGARRLKQNDLLFEFIDQYFPEGPYAFEPNMADGRFIMLPDNPSHQGTGVCVSNELPGLLEVCHLWYPLEYMGQISGRQAYCPSFSMKPGERLAKMVRQAFSPQVSEVQYCTFAFTPDLIVTLRGNFMNEINKTARTIRDALKDADEQIKSNGEALIHFMKRARQWG